MLVGDSNPNYLGGRGRRITSTQEMEVAVNQDHANALQPGQKERNSVSKKKKRRKRKTAIVSKMKILILCVS